MHKSYLKVFLFFSFWVLISTAAIWLLKSPVEADEKNGLKGVGVYEMDQFNNSLAAQYQCEPNLCRLSVVDLPSLENSGPAYTTTTKGKFGCFPSDGSDLSKLTGIGSQLEFRGDADIANIQKVDSVSEMEFSLRKYVKELGDKNKNDIPCYFISPIRLGLDPIVGGEHCGRNEYSIGSFKTGFLGIGDQFECFLVPEQKSGSYGYTIQCRKKGSLNGSVTATPVPVLYTQFYVDAISPYKRIIPQGARCITTKNSNGRAYWQYEDYFKEFTGETEIVSTCKNILLTKDLFGEPVDGTKTFFGCLPNSRNGLVAFVVRLVFSLLAVIAVLIGGVNFIMAFALSESKEAQAKAWKTVGKALGAFILILLIPTILSIFGTVFEIQAFGGGVLNFFTGAI